MERRSPPSFREFDRMEPAINKSLVGGCWRVEKNSNEIVAWPLPCFHNRGTSNCTLRHQVSVELLHGTSVCLPHSAPNKFHPHWKDNRISEEDNFTWKFTKNYRGWNGRPASISFTFSLMIPSFLASKDMLFASMALKKPMLMKLLSST